MRALLFLLSAYDNFFSYVTYSGIEANINVALNCFGMPTQYERRIFVDDEDRGPYLLFFDLFLLCLSVTNVD